MRERNVGDLAFLFRSLFANGSGTMVLYKNIRLVDVCVRARE